MYFLSYYVYFLDFAIFSLQKKLDFTLKIVGGEISSVPGISDAIEVRRESESNSSLLHFAY